MDTPSQKTEALRIAIYIPAYNAEKTLPKVIERIPEELKSKVKEIFVVDNDSSDNTYLTACQLEDKAHSFQYRVFRNKKNMGYGGSQKIAYEHAIKQEYDVIVMLHGDAQYAPEKINFLLEPFETGEADMVFGSRIAGLPLKGGMPLHRFLGNKFLTAIQNLALGSHFSEFHSGFRVFSCEFLKKIPFDQCADDYHFDTEIMYQMHLKDARIVERPIPTYYGDEHCYVNVVSYGLNILQTTFLYLLHKWRIRKFPPFDVRQPFKMQNYRDLIAETYESTKLSH